MADQLSADYIAEHRNSIHTPDSWGRYVIEKVLVEASSKLGDKSAEMTDVDVKFTVKPTTRGCVQVCAWGVCVHVEV